MHGQRRLCPVPVDTRKGRLWAAEGTDSRRAIDVAVLPSVGAYAHPATTASTTVSMRAGLFCWNGLSRIVVEEVKVLHKMSHYFWLVVQEC